MKNRTMLITAGFGLMMILSLFIGSVGVMAGPVGVTSAPALGPITSATLDSPANNSYLGFNDVLVSWTVVGGEGNWNETRMWSENEGWGNWINVSSDADHLFENLAEGLHYVEVNASSENDNPSTWIMNATFHVDTISPVVVVELPFEDATNLTNFTFSWEYTDPSPLVNTSIELDGPVVGDFETGNSSTSAMISNVTGDLPLTEGAYEMTVTVWDAAGNSASDVVEFLVGPVVELVTPIVHNPVYSNDNNFTIPWTVALFEGDAIVTQDLNVTNVDTGESWNVTLAGGVREYAIWDLLDGDVLADGNYTATIMVNDSAFYGFDIEPFVVDTAAPNIEFVAPNGEMNPWYTNNNNFTAIWAFAFDPLGTPIVDQVVTIANGTASMTASVNASELSVSVFNVWGMVLADDNYTIYLNATDAAGNWANESANFVVDTVPPVVELIVPDEDVDPTYISVSNFTAEWAIGADPMMTPIASIMVTIWNGTVNMTISVDVANTSANVSDVWGSVLPDGNYTIFVNVTDAAGNWANESANFVIDTIAPSVVITAPTNGSFVNTTNVMITWNATDLNGSGIQYLFIRNDTGTWTTLDNATVASQILVLAEGSHFVEVRAMDFAGNEFTANVTFTVDVTLPSVEILSPANGTIFGVNVVTVEWNGSDALSGLAFFEVNLDNLTWENVGFNHSKAFSGLSDGTHVVMVKAVDNATNENVTSVTFIVDTAAPFVNITQPANGMHTNVTNVQMNWTAVDNGTGIAYIHVWNDTGAFVNMTTGNGYLFVNLTEGAHTLHVQVWDMLNNSQEKTVSIVVDLTGPEIVITYPQEGGNVSGTINATWIVMDSLSPIAKIWVAIDNNTLVDVGLNTSQLFTGLSAGSHVIHVKAVDSVGNSATKNVSFVVEIVPPTVVSHLPASGAIVLPDVVVKVTFSEAMNQTSVSFAGITGTKTWNAAGTEVTLTHAALAYATTYNVVVSGKDLAGNELLSAGASWSFTVKTQVTGTINDDKGNPIVNATVTISQGGVTVAEGVTDAAGHFALLVDGVGTYNVTVSKTGFQNLVQNDKTFGVGQTNSLGTMAMTPNADYTLLIVGVVVVLAIILVALFLLRRRPAAKKP